MELAAGLPEPLRALLALFAIVLIIAPVCMAFGGLLGALFARRQRAPRSIAFGGTLGATVAAPFVLLAASRSADAFVALLICGLALPGITYWVLSRWATAH